MSATTRTTQEIDNEESAFFSEPHETINLRSQARTLWKNEQKISNDTAVDRWTTLTKYTVRKKEPNPKNNTRPFGKEIIFKLRKHLALLQGTKCCYCRRWLQNIAHARPIDHILSRDDYPQFSLHYRNLALACRDCNHQKSNKKWTNLDKSIKEYPKPESVTEYYHPRLHKFDGHIRYVRIETNDASIAIYHGLTDQGRQLCRDHLKKISQVDALFKNNRQLATSIVRLQAAGEKPSAHEMTRLNEFVETLHQAIFRISEG